MEKLVIAMVFTLVLVAILSTYKYVVGNKQFFDFEQNFNVAYIMSNGGKFERVRIKAWKDYDKSDSVQVILENGTPVYTHLRNVKLTKE